MTVVTIAEKEFQGQSKLACGQTHGIEVGMIVRFDQLARLAPAARVERLLRRILALGILAEQGLGQLSSEGVLADAGGAQK